MGFTAATTTSVLFAQVGKLDNTTSQQRLHAAGCREIMPGPFQSTPWLNFWLNKLNSA
jgi:hypothetical protein